MTIAHCLLLGACTAGHARACSDDSMNTSQGKCNHDTRPLPPAQCLNHRTQSACSDDQHEHLTGQVQS
eukprot:950650-Pelagomonas_calceolata.AAC.1